MFTPNRNKAAGLPGSRRSTPRHSSLRNTRKTSLLRHSINTRASLNITNTSFLSSPTVTAAFTSSNHTIESYDSSIPVLVTEAISLADDLSDISVTIGEYGWSWLVSGLKIFVWSHHLAGASRIPTCKELSLRAVGREDHYCAELISVFCNDETRAVSVLATSANGHLAYWPNILVSTATCYESKIALSGTQCVKVASIQKYGYLLCTLNGMMYHLFPTQNAFNCKAISKKEGTLSKIGRSVSSFFFSPSPSDNEILQMVVRGGRRPSEFTVLLLTRNCIQQWSCTFKSEREADAAQLISESEFNETFAPKLSIEVFDCVKPQFNVWAMDVQFATRKGQVAILLAGSEAVDVNSRVHYALIFAEDLSDLNNANIFMFQHFDCYSIVNESENYPYKLVVEDPSSMTLDHYIICSRRRALLRSFASVDGDYVEDEINFGNSGDNILGAGNCAGKLILFSALCGLVVSSSNFERRLPSMLGDSALDASYVSQSASNMSLPGTPSMSQSRIDQLENSQNSAQRLQAAFLNYCKVNVEQAHAIIAEAFPPDAANDLLDSAVATLSGELLDDYPAQDPRWAESLPQDVTSEAAGSFILLHQLEDKLKAHALYLKFLTDVGISDRLFLLGGSRDKVVTKWLLWEHAEKLHASIGLLQKHSAHQGLVDAAIRQALNHRDNVSSQAGLTPRDFFYREVTRINEIFEYLIEEEEAASMKSSLTSRERVVKISGVNAVFEAILNSVRQYRKNLILSYADERGNYYEFQPWTVGSGRQSIRKIVLQQLKITAERGLPEAEDGQQRALMCQSYSALADLVLEGYQEQIASLSHSEASQGRKNEVQAAFTNHRNTVISALVDVGQRERATSLAEKFMDFDMLIKICDQNKDNEKLKQYMSRFAAEGFMEFLFRWYMDRREYRKLLECGGKSHQLELKNFLHCHPHLAWMRQIKAGDYVAAHLTLHQLAEMERKSVEKKKTYLSLSKLAAAFSGAEKSVVEGQIEAISREQILIKYQDSLPTSVTNSLQSDEEMPVCSPVQLIQHYIGNHNENASESDYQKAFELLHYLPTVAMNDSDETAVDSEEWKMRIWCSLILRDSWKDVDTMLDASDSCSHTMLVKTGCRANESGLLVDILPNVDVLLNRNELNEFRNDASFRYIMKAIFEWMHRSIESSPA